MNRMSFGRLLPIAAVVILAAAYPKSATATSIVDVTLDTSALTVLPGSADGPFSLFIQLTDGSGTNDGNNSAMIDAFSFGGGTATPGVTLLGGASGDLSTAIVLTDTTFLNFAMQGFTPGASLSFRIALTTNLDAGTPDAFAFSILDSSGFPIPTLDPTFADTLLTVNIDSANPIYLTYATDLARGDVAMSAPVVRPETSPVPEPSTLSLLGVTLLGLAGDRLRRRNL